MIAYNGNVVVGAREWIGEYTDIPAMGFDNDVKTAGYCNNGDQVTFKLYKKASPNTKAIFPTSRISYKKSTKKKSGGKVGKPLGCGQAERGFGKGPYKKRGT